MTKSQRHSPARRRESDPAPGDAEVVSGTLPHDTIPSPPPPAALQVVPRIALVGDEERLGRAVQRLLRDYEVSVHTRAQDVFARIAIGERFDMILSDVAMIGMGGCELFEEIHRLDPEQAKRVVFLTGVPNESLASYGQPVLVKPFDPRELRTLVLGFVR
jgi:CheY-like chemotaxis protein